MSGHEHAEIRLINKVVVHFGYLPADQAVTEVAEHVRKFWDPRMKRRLLDIIESGAVDSGADELEPVALAAAALLR